MVHIELYSEGDAVARQVPEVLSRVYNTALADFTPEEWQQLQGFLRRLRVNAEQAPMASDTVSL